MSIGIPVDYYYKTTNKVNLVNIAAYGTFSSEENIKSSFLIFSVAVSDFYVCWRKANVLRVMLGWLHPSSLRSSPSSP